LTNSKRTASVYSTTGGSWGWRVNLTDDEIDNNAGHFVYRLYPPVSSTSVPYSDIPNQIPSRGFIIRKASEIAASSSLAAASQAASRSQAAAASKSDAAAASSTTQSAVTTTQTGSASTTAPTNASQNTAGVVDPVEKSSSGLSTGAKAGIAIGVVALALIAAVAIFFVLRRRRKQPSNTTAELSGQGIHHEDKTMYAQHGNAAPQYQQQGYAAPPSEMEAPVQNQRTYELAGSQAREP
jgi:LPXTG-motif cell wall-anchored protein